MTANTQSKAMNITLWIAQVILFLLFLMTGGTKLFQSIDAMAASMPWVKEVAPILVRFIGLSEVLGAIGLIVPYLTGIKPHLTVWAALGLVAVMLLAALFHLTRGEFAVIPVNVVLVLISLFVARGRSRSNVPANAEAQA